MVDQCRELGELLAQGGIVAAQACSAPGVVGVPKVLLMGRVQRLHDIGVVAVQRVARDAGQIAQGGGGQCRRGSAGAPPAIPKDLNEAAAVDGASAWQQFWKITVPMLRPAMGPSVAMGAVWTFNQFNVVFLVSGGEPDGETDILVSEAYRWAFTRQAQYGYASAYAVLIFLILLLVTRRRSPEPLP